MLSIETDHAEVTSRHPEESVLRLHDPMNDIGKESGIFGEVGADVIFQRLAVRTECHKEEHQRGNNRISDLHTVFAHVYVDVLLS